jgi:hypothetical protein
MGDPSEARSEAEYDKTGLFDMARALIGTRCKDMNRISLYLFFENTVKPRIRREKRREEINEFHASTSNYSKAVGLRFCNHGFTYEHYFGTDTQDITVDNPHGLLWSDSITFIQ